MSITARLIVDGGSEAKVMLDCGADAGVAWWLVSLAELALIVYCAVRLRAMEARGAQRPVRMPAAKKPKAPGPPTRVTPPLSLAERLDRPLRGRRTPVPDAASRDSPEYAAAAAALDAELDEYRAKRFAESKLDEEAAVSTAGATAAGQPTPRSPLRAPRSPECCGGCQCPICLASRAASPRSPRPSRPPRLALGQAPDVPAPTEATLE